MLSPDRMTPGRAYRTRELRAFSANPTRWANSLVSRGELRRLAQGLFYRPEQTFFGPVAPTEKEVLRAFFGSHPFLVTGPYYWNALDLGATALWTMGLVYNDQRTGEVLLGGQRYRLRRTRFPITPTPEWYVVDFLNNADAAGADPSLAGTLLVRALRSGRFEARSLRAMAEEYGRPAARTRIFRALAAAEAS